MLGLSLKRTRKVYSLLLRVTAPGSVTCRAAARKNHGSAGRRDVPFSLQAAAVSSGSQLNGLTSSVGRLTISCACEIARPPAGRQRGRVGGTGLVAVSVGCTESRLETLPEAQPASVSFGGALDPTELAATR
jgi:hypothetical protein